MVFPLRPQPALCNTGNTDYRGTFLTAFNLNNICQQWATLPNKALPFLCTGGIQSCPQSSCCSVIQSCQTLQSHGLQRARLPCPSPSPGACSNSCPWSQWCHPTISSSVVPFSSRLQSFPSKDQGSNYSSCQLSCMYMEPKEKGNIVKQNGMMVARDCGMGEIKRYWSKGVNFQL